MTANCDWKLEMNLFGDFFFHKSTFPFLLNASKYRWACSCVLFPPTLVPDWLLPWERRASPPVSLNMPPPRALIGPRAWPSLALLPLSPAAGAVSRSVRRAADWTGLKLCATSVDQTVEPLHTSSRSRGRAVHPGIGLISRCFETLFVFLPLMVNEDSKLQHQTCGIFWEIRLL